MWRSPGGSDAASLIVSISPMDENFPVESSLEAYFDSARSRAKNGEVDEVKWVEIDGVKGVQFREANPEKPDDHRRLHWITYRKYLGQVQMDQPDARHAGRGFRTPPGCDVRNSLFHARLRTKMWGNLPRFTHLNLNWGLTYPRHIS